MVSLGAATVDADDVAEGWRSLTDAQKTAATTLLTRAAAILLSQSPGLLDRLSSGVTPPEAVEQVLIDTVRRAMLPGLVNPDGAKKTARSVDDYTESVEWDIDSLLSGLYFTPAQLALVAKPGPGRRGRAFTINTMPTR